jgi:glycosyltransferase involved in cell wall biosynthesis
MAISVIIIAANQARVIEQCIKAAVQVSNDIVVVVNNTTDKTAELATKAGAKVVVHEWLGYGATKNFAHGLAKNNWILSLDADEYLDAELQKNICALTLQNEETVFNLTRKLLWQGKLLNYGVANEIKARLFHKEFAQWNNDVVHEELIYKREPMFVKLKGTLIHDSYANKKDAIARLEKYALLMAKKRNLQGKTKSAWPPIVHGAINFIIQLFVKGAILDGWAGIEFAWLNAEYTFKKYRYLNNNEF